MSWKLYVHITPNNKYYIGITSQDNPKTRWDSKGYGYKNQKLFWRAIQKYGWDNINHIVLLDNLTKDEACECEKYLIAKYQTNNPEYGYNLTNGGEGISGYKLTPEQIEVWRKNSTGRKHTQATKDKISKINKRRVYTEEQRKQMSIRAKGRPSNRKGAKLSEETKKKISESRKGIVTHTQKHTEETKKRIGDKIRGRVVSEETREKLRQKAKEQWKRQKTQNGGI